MLKQLPAERPSVDSEASRAELPDEREKRNFLDSLKKLCCSSWRRITITACTVTLFFILALLYSGSPTFDPNGPLPGIKLITEASGKVEPYQGDIQLLTFNILAEIWEGSGIEAERNEKILNTIQAREPDAILLQEAQDTSVNFILEGLNKGLAKNSPDRFQEVAFPKLDKTCWAEWLVGRAWRPNGQAILMKGKLVPHIVRAESINLSDPKDPGFYAPAVTLRMARHSSVAKRLPAAQLEYKDVCITNVHLWFGMDGGARKVQFDKIKRWVLQEKKRGRFDHILVAGDFNDVTGALMKENKSLFRNHGNDHNLQHIDTCANGFSSLRLDYVLSDPELISLKATCPNENPEGFGFFMFGPIGGSPFNWDRPWFSAMVSHKDIVAKYGSDHLPVTSLVRLL